MHSLTLGPCTQARGEVRLPGSKSLTNRALLLASLAEGETSLPNLLESDDTAVMRAALTQLGAHLEGDRIRGTGGFHGTHKLFLGNAGTAFRPLCAALAAGRGEFTLEGEPRMHERPIGPLVEALRALGARIDYLENEGYPPLRVHADGLRGAVIEMDPTLSSQYVTALLMAAPLAQGPVHLKLTRELVSKPYVHMTLTLMERFGVLVEHDELREFRIQPACYRSPGTLQVEGDASSASYFLAAGAIGGGPVRVLGVGKDSLQGDARFAELLEQMGAHVTWGPDWIEVAGGALKGLDRDLNDLPDAAMTLATVALFAQGPTVIRNVANWRVKESDRLTAMATELSKLGATVHEGADFLIVHPPGRWRPAEIATYNDHRIAMSFALASLGPQPVTILDPGCTSKTYPNFFEDWARLVR